MQDSDNTSKPSVTGEILFKRISRPVTGATLTIRLENVSRIDSMPELVAEVVQHGIRLQVPGPDKINFAINVPPVDPQADYIVQVHVDVDGDSRISKGDYINMQNYPVLTWGHPAHVSIEVHEIT